MALVDASYDENKVVDFASGKIKNKRVRKPKTEILTDDKVEDKVETK